MFGYNVTMGNGDGQVVSTDMLRAWLEALPRLSAVDDSDRLEQLRLLEQLKGASAASQARLAVDFDTSQRQAQRDAGTPARQLGKGIAAQIGLARRESPTQGARHLALGKALVAEMPHTLAALTHGEVSEWRATLVARETACLSRVDRAEVDAELAALPGGLAALGDGGTAAQARRIAYRLDPYAFTRRAARAAADRCVTLRPAPDTMTYLTGLLPVTAGVAVHTALTRHADTLRAGGDDRSRGQIMADTLVERVTGQATAAAVPVEVHLVMTDTALFGHHSTTPDQAAGEERPTAAEPARNPVPDGADPELAHEEPAHLLGYGPVPAPLVRSWLRDLPTHTRAWIRRLYTDPATGALVAMDSRHREFKGQLRAFTIIRDQVCRTPWCDAPIRHADHPEPAADGGPTSSANSQGLCEACNYAKQAPGWHARALDDGVVETTTPTGHVHRSHPPPAPGGHPRAPRLTGGSRLEASFRNLVLTA